MTRTIPRTQAPEAMARRCKKYFKNRDAKWPLLMSGPTRKELIAMMTEKELAIFGVPTHPGWAWKESQPGSPGLWQGDIRSDEDSSLVLGVASPRLMDGPGIVSQQPRPVIFTREGAEPAKAEAVDDRERRYAERKGAA